MIGFEEYQQTTRFCRSIVTVHTILLYKTWYQVGYQIPIAAD